MISRSPNYPVHCEQAIPGRSPFAPADAALFGTSTSQSFPVRGEAVSGGRR
jgi:hypothetical protein